MTNRSALLLHGLGSASGTWWRVEEYLKNAGWSVDAPDLRGHGRAERGGSYRHDDYVDDVFALGIVGNAWDVVIGHSLGGAVAVRAAARTPGWAGRLVLIDPVLRLEDADRAGVRQAEIDALAASLLEVAADHPHWDARDHEERFAGLRSADPAAIAGTIDDNNPWDRLADISAISIPTLILAGDPKVYTICGPSIVDEARNANRSVQYEVVTGAGHSPHRDRPTETLARLQEWL